MPVAVFCVGVSFGTEKFNWSVFSNMLVVSVGVCIASYGACAKACVHTAMPPRPAKQGTHLTRAVPNAYTGEINFIWMGVILQLASIVTESSRLTLVQLLLQSRGLKLNPITSLYYISPCCFAFLSIPFMLFEVSSS